MEQVTTIERTKIATETICNNWKTPFKEEFLEILSDLSDAVWNPKASGDDSDTTTIRLEQLAARCLERH